MNPTLLNSLVCPYCGGPIKLSKALQEADGDIQYGLAACRCFVFPIVEGILLLSLSKGYGGAEEALQPYAPLQAIALHFLEQDQVARLKDWIREHLPLAAPFIGGSPGTYLEYSAQLADALDLEVDRFLAAHGRFGVLWKRVSLVKRLARSLRTSARERQHELAQLTQFYPSRYFSPCSQRIALQLGRLPLSGRVLSLCCGQGMFENFLAADGRATEVVSVDGQFLNLLVTKHFVRPEGQFICQDVQLGLPFADGAFEAVFSSTCLPEIPAQRAFATEAIRVTAAHGWTWFDAIWNGELGGPRVIPTRFYRFAQNFFTRLEDYPAFFRECASAQRTVSVLVPTAPQRDLSADQVWTSSVAEIDRRLGGRGESQISVLVTDPAQFPGAVATPAYRWLDPKQLSISPAFDARFKEGDFHLHRREGFGKLSPTFAPNAFAGYPEHVVISAEELRNQDALLNRFCEGSLAILPKTFDRDTVTLDRAA